MKRKITGINPDAVPTGPGCVDCQANGTWWLHLRRCAECGHIGCCDSSPHQHATKHAHKTTHPIITSFEPGEEWFYDYRIDSMIDAPPFELKAPTSHPIDQPVPGPEDRVPPDWMSLLH